MEKKYKLKPELIPRSSYFNNLRSNYSSQDWDYLRKDCYKKAKYRCEICNEVGPSHPVECHEVWSYIDGVQKLERLIALCPDCHMCMHFGLAGLRGQMNKVYRKLMKVNKISRKEADLLIEISFEEWHDRSSVDWTLDMSEADKILKKRDLSYF